MFIPLSSVRLLPRFKMFVFLLFLWLSTIAAMGQTFSVTHTDAECYNSGTITVTITGTNAGATWEATIQHQSSGETYTLNFSNTTTFNNLMPGTYSATIKGPTTYSTSIVIADKYTPLVLSKNNYYSRKSYTGCGTGTIAINRSGGTGNLIVEVVSGPSHVGETLSYTEKQGILGNTKSYTYYLLDGQDWLPGTYTLRFLDECQYKYELTYTVEEHNDWDLGRWSITHFTDRINITYDRHNLNQHNFNVIDGIDSGLYEFAVLGPWMSEADLEWKELTHQVSSTIIPPDNYETIISSSSPPSYVSIVPIENRPDHRSHRINGTIYIRLKHCPTKVHKFTQHLGKTAELFLSGFNTTVNNPDQIQIKFFVSGFAKEKTFNIYNDDLLVFTKELTAEDYLDDNMPEPNNKSLDTRDFNVTVPISKLTSATNKLKIEVISEIGNKLYNESDYTTLGVHNNTYTIYTGSNNVNICGIYTQPLARITAKSLEKKFNYNEMNKMMYLMPTLKLILNKAELYDGDNLLESTDTPTFEYTFRDLEVNKTYRLKLRDANGVYEYRLTPRYNPSPSFANEVIYDINYNTSYELASIYDITLSYRGGIVGAGSTLTLETPDGRVFTLTQPQESGRPKSFSVNKLVGLPVGTYKATAFNTCTGVTNTKTFFVGQGYQVHQVDINPTYTCNTVTIAPTAHITLNNVSLPSSKIKFGVYLKDGNVPQKLFSQGQTITLNKHDNYVFYITVDNSDYTKYISSDTLTDKILTNIPISLYPNPLSLNKQNTLTYNCGTGSAKIIAQATGGIGKYTYSLYTSDADRKASQNAIVTRTLSNSELFTYEYGTPGQTLYFRVSDECNTAYEYSQTIADDNNYSQIGYVEEARLCAGDPIRLRVRGIDYLKQYATFTWYDPQGQVIANTASHDIPNATVSHSGTYKLVSNITGCSSLEQLINITVDPPFTITQPSIKAYTSCVGTPITIAGPSTTATSTTTQWEIAREGISQWDNSNLTGYEYLWGNSLMNFTPNGNNVTLRFVPAGTYVLRAGVSRNTCTEYSEPIIVTIKHCTVPVNPQLMYRPIVNWSSFTNTPTKLR